MIEYHGDLARVSAYISQLELLAEHRGRGIGSALVRAMLERLDGLYMIDLICDADVQPFYARLGLTPWTAMIRRDPTSNATRRTQPG